MTLKTMLYITTNIQPFLKDIVMQIGLLGQLKQNLQVDTFFYYWWRSNILEIIQTNMYSSLYNAVWIHCFRQGRWRSWMAPEFLRRYSILAQTMAPICIHCDSQAAIGRAGSIMYNGKSRHIRLRHNSVRQLLFNGIITIDYVKSKYTVSDPLTKGLNREGVEKSSMGMGLWLRTSHRGDNST